MLDKTEESQKWTKHKSKKKKKKLPQNARNDEEDS